MQCMQFPQNRPRQVGLRVSLEIGRLMLVFLMYLKTMRGKHFHLLEPFPSIVGGEVVSVACNRGIEVCDVFSSYCKYS